MKKRRPNDEQGEDIANGLLYSFLSGGIISLFGYIIIIFLILKENMFLIKETILNRITLEQISLFYLFSVFSCNFFILRSFL